MSSNVTLVDITDEKQIERITRPTDMQGITLPGVKGGKYVSVDLAALMQALGHVEVDSSDGSIYFVTT